ncbi:MAG: hypothetical protein LQ346_003032 [Caloplaca aetnensis]|nr:MAG: hypothetical protein LQ346_003032 [Caloplaca aetnensis]
MRRTLFQTGHVTQAAFYSYRENVYDKIFSEVHRDGKNFILYEGEYGSRVLVPFNNTQFPEKEDKEALLSYSACTYALIVMDRLISNLLHSMSIQIHPTGQSLPPVEVVSELSEICCTTRNHSRIITFYHGNGVLDQLEYQHQVFYVRLKNEEKYIIDLAGAQYGYYAPVIWYDTYFKTLGHQVLKRSPRGDARESWKRKARLIQESLIPKESAKCHDQHGQQRLLGSPTEALVVTHQRYVDLFNECVNMWEESAARNDRKLSLSAMVELPQSDFQRRSVIFLAALTAVIQRHRAMD